MKKTTIERANFRLIESELYSFHDTMREIEQLRSDILHGGSTMESEIRGTDIGNPTAQKALKLATSPHILELERRVNAIQFAIQMLRVSTEPKKLELLQLKYFERQLTDQGIMQRLCIEQATYYRWRREIIETVAMKLGWKV